MSYTEVPLAGDRIGGAREHEHHRSSRISFENMNIIASLTLTPLLLDVFRAVYTQDAENRLGVFDGRLRELQYE
jgi:hypothetical protein